jgi:TonB family protein
MGVTGLPHLLEENPFREDAMFDVLMASRTPGRRGMGRGVMSAGLHLVVIAGAIRATAGAAAPIAEPVEHPAIWVVDPPPASPRPAYRSSGPGPVLPGPRLVVPPVDVPPGLPPVELGSALDVSRFDERGAVPPGPGPAGADSSAGSRAFSVDAVDDPAEVLHQPEPRYPPALLHAGVVGRVLVEFIIDTAGHAETASLRIVESSNPAFEAAAVETIRRSLFRPARVRGRVVRQLTRQAIGFRIAPD